MTLPLSFRAQREILGQWGRISPFGRNDRGVEMTAVLRMPVLRTFIGLPFLILMVS